MMRSEKRGSSGPVHHSPDPGKKPPRRRRRRAGFFYKLLTMLLLLTLWPVGLFLLWRRKLRWGVATKLLTSIVTLAACVVLIGFARTVQTDNVQYTAVQDSVNTFLDEAADTLINVGDIVSEKAEVVYEGMSEMSDALWSVGKTHLADGIDAGVLFAEHARQEVTALLESVRIEGESTPEPTAETAPAETEEDAEIETSEETEPTSAPQAAELSVNADDTSLPIFMPESSPAAQNGKSIAEGTLSRSGILVDGEVAPTVEPVVQVPPTPSNL